MPLKTDWVDGNTVHDIDLDVMAAQVNALVDNYWEIASGTGVEIPTGSGLEITRYAKPDALLSSSATSLTLSTDYDIYEFTGSSGATWPLPPVSGNRGERITVSNRGTALVNITTVGSDQIFGATSGLIVTYILVVGTSVDLLCDGTYWVVQAETQPWVTKWASRNPGSHNVPAAFTSYYDKPNTAYASLATNYPVFDTGQPITYSPGAGTPSQPAIVTGALALSRTGATGASAAAYMNLDAGSGNTLTRIGGKVRFDNTGASTNGHAFTLAMSNANGLISNGTAYRIGAHLNVVYNQWSLTKVSNATGSLVFTVLASGSLENNMEANNLTEYTMELWRVGNALTAILPDGQRITATDVDVSVWATQYGYFEPSMNVDTTDTIPAITEVWYGINTQYPPGDTGLIRRDDIVNERSFARTLTNVTLTAPKVNYILDATNGFPTLLFAAIGTAVNYVGIVAQQSGSPPYITSLGSDTNSNLLHTAQGTGVQITDGFWTTPNVLSASRTIAAGYGAYVPDLLEIASGVACEISATSMLEIG